MPNKWTRDETTEEEQAAAAADRFFPLALARLASCTGNTGWGAALDGSASIPSQFHSG